MPWDPDDDLLDEDEIERHAKAEQRQQLAAIQRRRRVQELRGPRPGPPVSPSDWPKPRQELPTFPRHAPAWVVDDTRPGRGLVTWTDCVETLEAERLGRDLTIRGLAAAAGVPATSVVNVISGRVWPSWRTLGLLCQALDLRPALEQQMGPAPALQSLEARVRPPQREALEAEAKATADREALPAVWHNIAVAQLRWLARAVGARSNELAEAAYVRASTWSEARPNAPEHWVSLPVTLAVADLFNYRLRLRDADRAWPLGPWQYPPRV